MCLWGVGGLLCVCVCVCVCVDVGVGVGGWVCFFQGGGGKSINFSLLNFFRKVLYLILIDFFSTGS